MLLTINEMFDESPLNMALVLLAVAHRPGSTSAEVAVLMRVSKTTLSRYVHLLGAGSAPERGLGLVAMTAHRDGRASALFLTRKGAKAVHLLCTFLRPAGQRPDERVSEDF
jgi:DNA-binding MarR family transcriptional regulator